MFCIRWTHIYIMVLALSSMILSTHSASAQSSAQVALDFKEVVKDIRDAREGNAIAAALSGTHLSLDADYKLNGSAGYFERDGALAAQTAVRLDQTYFWDGGVGITVPNGMVAGRFAFSGEW